MLQIFLKRTGFVRNTPNRHERSKQNVVRGNIQPVPEKSRP
jgi:hypothetical protein